jgi:hypothetical protein
MRVPMFVVVSAVPLQTTEHIVQEGPANRKEDGGARAHSCDGLNLG